MVLALVPAALLMPFPEPSYFIIDDSFTLSSPQAWVMMYSGVGLLSVGLFIYFVTYFIASRDARARFVELTHRKTVFNHYLPLIALILLMGASVTEADWLMTA